MKRVIYNRENKDILSIMEEEKERLSHSASVLEKELGGYVNYVLSSPIFMTYMIINRKKSIPSKTTNARADCKKVCSGDLYKYARHAGKPGLGFGRNFLYAPNFAYCVIGDFHI